MREGAAHARGGWAEWIDSKHAYYLIFEGERPCVR